MQPRTKEIASYSTALITGTENISNNNSNTPSDACTAAKLENDIAAIEANIDKSTTTNTKGKVEEAGEEKIEPKE